MAGEVLMSISKDERERAIFRNRRIALANLESDMETVKSIGFAEGEAKGKADVARNLLGLNIPLEQIIAATGLTRTEVEALRDTGSPTT